MNALSPFTLQCPEFSRIANYASFDCRSPIETSPASPIEMSRSPVCVRLVGVARHDGDHDELQRADALRVLIDVADGRLSVADARGLIGVRLAARRVRRQWECHLYFCTPSDISTLRRQLRRMSGDKA